MSNDAEYRLRAFECAEAAERTGDLRERLELLEMAQAWIKLADYARSVPAVPAVSQPFRPERGNAAIGEKSKP